MHAAQRATAEKWAKVRARDNWYNNPLRFLDAEDIFYPDGGLRGRDALMAVAGEIFRENRGGTPDILEDILHGSLPGSKDVQRTVLLKMLRDALASFAKRGTRSQIDALVLAREAALNGETATTYIARERGINRHSAYKLLKRAEQALLETSGTNSGIMKIEKRIKDRARKMPRVCIYCGKQCQDGLHALCKECHARFVYRGEFLDKHHERQIQDSMRISTLEHWRKARQLVQQT